jgi:CRISPR-associated protein Cmr5
MTKHKNKHKHNEHKGTPAVSEPKKDVTASPANASAENQAAAVATAEIKPKSIAKAEIIMKKIQNIQNELDEKFVNFLKGLPAMIMQNGLGQTIAYLQTKDKKEQKVADLFGLLLVLEGEASNTKLMDRILSDTPEKYTLRQRDAIEYAGWMKKFAIAFRKSSSADKKDKEKKDG